MLKLFLDEFFKSFDPTRFRDVTAFLGRTDVGWWRGCHLCAEDFQHGVLFATLQTLDKNEKQLKIKFTMVHFYFYRSRNKTWQSSREILDFHFPWPRIIFSKDNKTEITLQRCRFIIKHLSFIKLSFLNENLKIIRFPQIFQHFSKFSRLFRSVVNLHEYMRKDEFIPTLKL